jgi:hypothetical protein
MSVELASISRTELTIRLEIEQFLEKAMFV